MSALQTMAATLAQEFGLAVDAELRGIAGQRDEVDSMLGAIEEDERHKLAQIFALRRQAAEALSAAVRMEESMHERRRIAMTEAREKLRQIGHDGRQLALEGRP